MIIACAGQGLSGNFIKNLLVSSYYDITFPMSKHGNCHRDYYEEQDRVVPIQKKFKEHPNEIGLGPLFLNEVLVYDDNNPTFRVTNLHYTRPIEIVKKYPNTKIVYVYHGSDTDVKTSSLNFIVKEFFESYGLPSWTLLPNNWSRLKKEINYYKPDMTLDEFILHGTYEDRKILLDLHYQRECPLPRWKKLFEEQQHANIFELKLSELFDSNYPLLEKLAEFVNMPISNKAVEFLKIYRENQPNEKDYLDGVYTAYNYAPGA